MRNDGRSIRVAICDDHVAIRSALRDLLEDEPDVVIVGETTTADEAVREVRRSRPYVLLLDISMRGRSGLDALPGLREASPQTGIVIISVEGASRFRQAAFAAGARGYVSKDAPGKIISAVRQAALPVVGDMPAAEGPGAADAALERRAAARDRRTGSDRRLSRSSRTPGMERRLGDRRSTVDRRRHAVPTDAR